MMQKDGHIWDDLARLAGSAAGSVLEAKRQLEQITAAQIEKLLGKMQLVTREEFEVVSAMAAKAREEQDVLKRHIESLEMRVKSLEKDN